MAVKFGEIDSSQILDNEFRISVLEKILQEILDNNPDLDTITPERFLEIRISIVENLRNKYPNSGISLKESK